jgi:hypothetical protein
MELFVLRRGYREADSAGSTGVVYSGKLSLHVASRRRRQVKVSDGDAANLQITRQSAHALTHDHDHHDDDHVIHHA